MRRVVKKRQNESVIEDEDDDIDEVEVANNGCFEQYQSQGSGVGHVQEIDL